jgi:transcription elongation factor/antiterminator RfaH
MGKMQASHTAASNCETDAARWYVVQTQNFAEIRAMTHLERQGYRVFYPCYRKVIHHARKQTRSIQPLFPSYLFLQLDAFQHRWRSVNGTRGVVRLLTQGEYPIPVPRGVVESLQAHAGDDGALAWAPSLEVGQIVRVSEGPFAELVGKLERLDADGRVCVLLDLLGRSVSVNLHCGALDPAA